jgi:general L-amino acid transport system permease protein
MPQALKISIPGIVSSFIGLFKDTVLVIFVGLFDPLKGVTDAIRGSFAWKGAYWEPFIFAGVIFFIICFSMSRYSMYLERKLHRDHR